MLKRQISTGKTRMVDEAKGIVDFVATSPTPDSYSEVVDPKGADTSRTEKNGPLLVDHNYTCEAVIGKQINSWLEGRQLIMRCQFAIDVPENTLAIKIFAMVKAGYIRACSIGFIPTQVCKPSDSDWKEVCDDLGLGGLENSVRCVYQKWQLLELSICAIGANPDAVARAYQDGIIEDSDLLRWPDLRRSLQSAQPQPATSDATEFMKTFETLIKGATTPTVTQAAESLEFARRGQSETELFRSCGAMRYALARRQRMTAQERALEILQDPLVKEFLNALPRYAAQMTYLDKSGPNLELVRKSLTTAPGSLGGSLLPIGVCDAIVDLIYT
jgi:phage head maturation protease